MVVTGSTGGCFYDYLCTGNEDCGENSRCTNQGTCEPLPEECVAAVDCLAPSEGTIDCYDAECVDGVCRYLVATGRPCGAAGCGGGAQWEAPRCSVSGTCEAPKSTACHPYACDGERCASSCSDEGHCALGFVCDGGACEDPECQGAPTGTPCGDPTDSPCDHPDSCNGAGACLPNFELPDIPCGSGDASTCDQPDTCDGQGTCSPNYLAQGVPCGDGASGTCDAPDSCDGDGQCAANLLAGLCESGDACVEDIQCGTAHCNGGLCCEGGTCCTDDTPCGGYLCDTATFVCGTACSADGGCAQSAHCEGAQCVADLLDEQACTRDAQCVSGSCSGGLCGPTACFANAVWEPQTLCDFSGSTLGSQTVLDEDGCAAFCDSLENAVCCHIAQLSDTKLCIAFDEATGLKPATGGKAFAAAYCGDSPS